MVYHFPFGQVYHPRQIGALGAHSEKWCNMHREWERTRCDTLI